MNEAKNESLPQYLSAFLPLGPELTQVTIPLLRITTASLSPHLGFHDLCIQELT